MNNTCPYCNDCDTYYSYFLVIDGYSGGFNKCTKCERWSMYDSVIGMKELPETLTDEQLNNLQQQNN